MIRACAEAIPLPDHSVDLITVATALHWFDPQPARVEFRRILKPGGWLAVLGNNVIGNKNHEAFEALLTPENGVSPTRPAMPADRQPFSFYYARQGFQKLTFPNFFQEDWEHFFGGLLSNSSAPDEDHPLYPNFEQAARQIFDHLSQDGWLEMQCETELLIGQP